MQAALPSDARSARFVPRGKGPAPSTFCVAIHVEGCSPELVGRSLRSAALQTSLQLDVFLVGSSGSRTSLQTIVPGAQLQFCSWCELVLLGKSRWVVMLRAGDELLEEALSIASKSLAAAPSDLCMAYADEELVRPDGPELVMKPAWSPVFMGYCDYAGSSWLIRAGCLADLLDRAGDSCLVSFPATARALGIPDRSIGHLPASLFRSERGPTPAERVEIASLRGLPAISVIIPSRLANEDMLRDCIDGLLRRTDYDSLEILLALNGGAERPGWLHPKVRVLQVDRPAFSWSAVNNLAARHACGDLFLFLNDDTSVVQPEWLRTLASLLVTTGAGAVGPLLTYPNGSIQHVGMSLVYSGGGTQHVLQGMQPTLTEHEWLTSWPREVAALTGAALLTPRAAFQKLNGFDERYELVCNDSDYCLRLRRQGWPVLIDPRAHLVHREKASREGLDEMPDVLRFWSEWERELRRGDPYAHPNLRQGSTEWKQESDARLHRTAVRWLQGQGS